MPCPLYAGRCGPDAAAQLQPIPYACGAQRALLPIAMSINELMNINDVRESATIFPRPCKLTFDLLTFINGVRVTCDVGYLFADFGLSRPFCSRVIIDVRDRQTDVRQKHRLMPPHSGRVHNNLNLGLKNLFPSPGWASLSLVAPLLFILCPMTTYTVTHSSRNAEKTPLGCLSSSAAAVPKSIGHSLPPRNPFSPV